MKHFITPKIAVAALLALSVPVTLLAQDNKKENTAEQIIITRKGATDGKTVIEITGDKVIVNGKEVDKKGDGDVTVRRNKLRDVEALTRARVYGNQAFNFDFDNDQLSLFSEDENRAMLGVSTKDSENEKVKGAQVMSVSKGSAADKAGLKAGDVITRIGDKKIENAEDVSKAVREYKPGKQVAVTIVRDGKEEKHTAELDKWKGVNITAMSLPRMADVYAPATPHAPNAMRPGQGGTFYYNSGQPRLGLSIQDTEDGKGVKVLDVMDDSNADKAGLEEDDVITHINDKAVNSADEVSKLVKEAKDKPSFTVKVLRDGKTRNLEVRTPRRLKTTSL